MGNRVTLYNLSQAIPSCYLWLDTLDHVPQNVREGLPTLKFAEIGDTNNTGIPIPWMLYFGMEDFQVVSVQWDEDTNYRLPMPCTSVDQARQRILAALPIFERLAGDPKIGHEYWQEAVDVLGRLPFQYLAMDHAEWLGCSSDDPEVDFEEFKMAFANGAPADDFLAEYSSYSKNGKPYSHDEWDRLVTRFDWQNDRQMNAIAMGHGHSAYSTLRVNEGGSGQSKSYEIEC